MTSERDAHPDEGTIHAWLDRQLDDATSDALEAHLQRCDECAERVAEARGLIAGASRIVAALDVGDPVASPVVAGSRVAASPPSAILPVTRARGLPTFRLTPARSSIAAVLVVAVALAIVHENQRPSAKLASQAAENATVTGAPAAAPTTSVPLAAPLASPLAAAPGAPANGAPSGAPSAAAGSEPTVAAHLDSTADVRVAAARTFAKAQRETTVSADLARVAQVPTPAASAPVEQTIAAARAADSAVGATANALRGSVPGVAIGASRGVVGGAAKTAFSTAPTAAPSPVVEAPQCFRVESATGTSATWGPVALPFVLALDAPATRATARVLTVAGQDADVRAVFERRPGDSLLFTLRRIGYTGTLAVGAPGDVRAGVMRSAPTTLTLSEVVTTDAGAESTARRGTRAKSSAQARRNDAPPPAAEQQPATAAPAVPVVVTKIGCGARK